RLRMLATMARAPEEVCVCDFTDALPLNQPTVSHHLRILREAGLVTCERRDVGLLPTRIRCTRPHTCRPRQRLPTESDRMKTHLNLATTDLEKSVAFYSALLGATPAKRLDDYA